MITMTFGRSAALKTVITAKARTERMRIGKVGITGSLRK
jgi:hypothetical protein